MPYLYLVAYMQTAERAPFYRNAMISVPLSPKSSIRIGQKSRRQVLYAQGYLRQLRRNDLAVRRYNAIKFVIIVIQKRGSVIGTANLFISQILLMLVAKSG